MNKALSILMKKLAWQIEEAEQEFSERANNIVQLEQELIAIRQVLENALTLPATFLPEKEISRLNFIIRQQQLLDDVGVQKNQSEYQQQCLHKRCLRLRSELAMLEKYHQQQLSEEGKIQQKKEQTCADDQHLQHQLMDKIL